MKDLRIVSGAQLSEDRKYRFLLWRIWDDTKPLVMFIGLNPSKADETEDDPTMERVMAIAAYNGFGGVYMCNCFPLISTDSSVELDLRIVGRLNLAYIKETAKRCREIVFAWGNFKVVQQSGKDSELIKLFPNAKALYINKNGTPKHPLYCKIETKIIDFKK